MASFGQFCPVSRALEVIGERWTLLIVRDLLHGVTRFNELARGLPHVSRGLLSKRLKALCDDGIVERVETADGVCYRATQAGEELRPLVYQLVSWGTRWTFDAPREDELDPVLLMWWMRRRVATDRLPEARQVVQFDFAEVPGRSYWLVMERSDVSVCFDPPPFEVDVWVETSLATMFEVWSGKADFAAAIAAGRLAVRGLPWQERAFPGWFLRSPGAPLVERELAVLRGRGPVSRGAPRPASASAPRAGS